MSRPQIIEVNYFEFKRALERAREAGNRVEKKDKTRWDTYLKDNKVNEVAMMHWGRTRYDEVQPVIIDDDSEWAGFYVFSADEEAVLKWTR